MANKGLITCIGGATILTAGIVTSMLGNSNKLENSLKPQTQQSVYQNYDNNQNRSVIRYVDSKAQPIGDAIDLRELNNSRIPIRNVQEVISAPIPSQIQSDLPPQTQLIGYTQETVPVITQHWHQGYGIIPRPVCTFFRWLFGVRPYIPEWRRVPTAPVLHSQIEYQIQIKPIVSNLI